MSAATVTGPRAGGSGRPQLFAGTGTLLRFSLRRDRLRLAIWAVAVGGLTVYSAFTLSSTYPTAADRQARAAVMSNPAAVMLSGPGYGVDDYSLGAMIANEVALTVMLAAAVMSIMMIVRHTRAEEETGRAELVRAGSVGRRAALTSALGLVALANSAIAVVVAVGLVGAGLRAVDALGLAAGIALTGLVFGAVAAVTAQLTEFARAASGLALAVLGAAAVVRGVGDVERQGGSALSWFSPLAWAQQTRTFVDLRWWPLGLSAVLIAVLVAVAYRLVATRDVDAGLFPARRGPADAGRLLSSPAGLSIRLQRASVVAWAVALLLLGVTFGSLTDAVADMLGENAKLAALLETVGGQSLTDAFSAVTALYLALGVTAFAVGSVLRLRGEESAGRTELLLATALDRRRYLGSGLAVTAVAATLLLLCAGLGTGVSAAMVTGDRDLVGTMLAAAMVPLPAVLVIVGIGAAFVGLAPRLSFLAWVAVGWSALVGLFSGLLGLPTWVTKLSPFGWVPSVPAEDLDPLPMAALTLLAALLFAVALAGFRRRDVPT